MAVDRHAQRSAREPQIRLVRQDTVAYVTLMHAGRLNAITVGMWQELTTTFQALEGDASLRCVCIMGDGDNFAAGADIREFPRYRGTKADVVNYHTAILAPALHAIAACPVPVVAAIKGVCVGGGLEIAAQCDLRIAARSARFGVPINRLGFPMAPEEMRGLLRLAGPAATLEILLEGRVFDANEAMSKGLLTRVVDDDAFDAQVQALIARLARAAPLAARINKETVRRLSADPGPLSSDECEHLFRYAETRDHREGVNAFLAGSVPTFSGD